MLSKMLDITWILILCNMDSFFTKLVFLLSSIVPESCHWLPPCLTWSQLPAWATVSVLHSNCCWSLGPASKQGLAALLVLQVQITVATTVTITYMARSDTVTVWACQMGPPLAWQLSQSCLGLLLQDCAIDSGLWLQHGAPEPATACSAIWSGDIWSGS